MIKPNIKNGISYDILLSYLEPYLIYRDDITYNQYELINSIVESEIIKYKKEYIENINSCRNFLLKSNTFNLKTQLIKELFKKTTKTLKPSIILK